MLDDSKANIIWYDPSINSLENSYYSQILKDKYYFSGFTEAENAISLLKENPHKNFTVITAGKNGEEFCNYIEFYANVNHIIIFCLNVQYHQTWAIKFPKIIGVYSDPGEVLNKLELVSLDNLFDKNCIDNFNPNMNMDMED